MRKSFLAGVAAATVCAALAVAPAHAGIKVYEDGDFSDLDID